MFILLPIIVVCNATLRDPDLSYLIGLPFNLIELLKIIITRVYWIMNFVRNFMKQIIWEFSRNIIALSNKFIGN